jgi:hypothetical protein
MSRDPRWEECTICTAATPDAVFTVRTYGHEMIKLKTWPKSGPHLG